MFFLMLYECGKMVDLRCEQVSEFRFLCEDKIRNIIIFYIGDQKSNCELSLK